MGTRYVVIASTAGLALFAVSPCRAQLVTTQSQRTGTYATEDPVFGGLLELHRDHTFYVRQTKRHALEGPTTEEYAGQYSIEGDQVTFTSPIGTASRARFDENGRLHDKDATVWRKMSAPGSEGRDAVVLRRYLKIMTAAEERYHATHSGYTNDLQDFQRDSAFQRELRNFLSTQGADTVGEAHLQPSSSNRPGVIVQVYHNKTETFCRVYFGTDAPLVSGVAAGKPICFVGPRKPPRIAPEDSIAASLNIKRSSSEYSILRTMLKDLENLQLGELRFHGATRGKWTAVIGPDGLNLSLTPGNEVLIQLSHERYGDGLRATIINSATNHFCVTYMNAEPQPPAQTTNQAACGYGHADSLQGAFRAVAESLRSAEERLRADSIRRVVADSTERERLRADSIQRAAAESTERERQRTSVVPLVDVASLTIPSLEYRAFAFRIGGTADCRVEGSVRGLLGGRRDVEVYVFAQDDFLKWTHLSSWKTPDFGLYRSARQTITDLDVALPEPVEYQLVISNRFSAATEKLVQARVSLRCVQRS